MLDWHHQVQISPLSSKFEQLEKLGEQIYFTSKRKLLA